jgi:orotate phosphoribosyltransferase
MRINKGLSGRKDSLDLFNIGAEAFINLVKVLDRVAGMQYGGVIAITHLNPDLGERQLSMFFDKIHGHLTRLHDFTFT